MVYLERGDTARLRPGAPDVMTLNDWAQRHNISTAALLELAEVLNVHPDPPRYPTPRSEAAVQTNIRLDAGQHGGILWRNNVGVAVGDDGVPVRYGLANESKRVNRSVKSSDLIGFTPVAGTAVFTAIECKRAEWRWTGTSREVAQRRYIHIVQAGGGLAGFARGVDEYRAILRGE